MHFTVEAQRMAAKYLFEGAIAIDATAGNGFDTLFLAEHVGESGTVYAIDIQQSAIDSICKKLLERGFSKRCKLICQSHAQLDEFLRNEHRGEVAVAMLNLGYLPLGDKNIITASESTLSALDRIHHVLLRPGGLLTVLAYPGHPGGRAELESVIQWVEDHRQGYQVDRFQDFNNPKSPVLWAMERTRNDK